MHTVVCCDDNKAFCDLLEMLLKDCQKTYDIKIEKFYDAEGVLQFCSDNSFDIVYLDIELGEENGLKLAKRLKYINPKSLMIYISAYDSYYVDMVQFEPFKFIKKDASNIERLRGDLVQSLSDAIKRIDDASKFAYVFRRNKYVAELNKIKYFHSVARTIHIHGNIGDMPEYFYGNMDELQEKLEEKDNSFERISKSYIVNMNYVKAKSRKQVWIEDKVLSVTFKYRDEFAERHFTGGNKNMA